ncbi:60S acidic ribosomal protein P0 [Trichinella pseudospiralis]|uniref:60S acidic ribosomal protein P0 n=1 Tax=Trichinella pseudospiralis TaxID=6337 RepID=A0A0V1IGJ4_TRIPS|nr:60S acidic ribosomal protein P0 [Trichinella pseudospiralis]KRZ21884.1 60S acidic ribosomal protein P0 [Trichinella pseudospiralis]
MVREDKTTWKSNYFLKLVKFLEEYPKCFIVGVDNVGSNQMQQIRISLRGRAELLMGKNTMIRKAIRGYLPKNPDLECLIHHIVGNVGFVFTNEDLADVRDAIIAKKVAAPAKAGIVAPIDVRLPAQNTGLGPEKTSFFQALNIPTKISKGTIEILNEKVGASEAALLNMLNILPFSYGLVIKKVYDSGSVYDPSVLDITSDFLLGKVQEGIRHIASLSLAINYPTAASAPHMIANAFKNLLSIAAVTDITFKEAEKLKEYLADPSKFAVAAAPAASAAAAPKAEKEDSSSKKEEKVEEESDEEEGMGGLFDF